MADVTFRDFAAAIMKGDVDAAGAVLQQLLGLPAAQAHAAAQHFSAQSTAQGPAFMGKAMGLRAAVSSGSEAEIGALLRDCFAPDRRAARDGGRDPHAQAGVSAVWRGAGRARARVHWRDAGS